MLAAGRTPKARSIPMHGKLPVELKDRSGDRDPHTCAVTLTADGATWLDSAIERIDDHDAN
jgi:hypothetical protein